MGTRVIDKKYISLGLAELFLADSLTYISNTGQALNNGDYFGAKSDVSFVVEKEYLERHGVEGNAVVLVDHLLSRSSITIDIQFLEMNVENLSYTLGGDGTPTDFMEDLFSNPNDLRAELVFTYPNKINQMILVLPKIHIVTSNVDLSFRTDDAMQLPLTIKALKTDNANWVTRPLGKSIFV